MRKLLENAFLIILSIALFVFVIFLLEEAVSYTSKDYQYALIGALGSLIGGSLTLAGVWWTLRNQAKTDFINEFPRKIRSLEEIINKMQSMRRTGYIFNDILPGNRNGIYEQNIAEMKDLATDVDGNCYFIVGKLEHLYNDYLVEKISIPKFEPELRDEMGRPLHTKEFNVLIEKYENKMDEIIRELREYNRELTDKFIRYRK